MSATLYSNLVHIWTPSKDKIDLEFLFKISGFWWFQEETSSESNDFYHLSTSRAGKSFRKISLSRRLFQGGARHESQFAWGSRAGTITSSSSFSELLDSLCYTTIKWINEVQSEAICCPFLEAKSQRPNWIFSLTFIRASKETKIELSHPKKDEKLFCWSQQLLNFPSLLLGLLVKFESLKHFQFPLFILWSIWLEYDMIISL